MTRKPLSARAALIPLALLLLAAAALADDDADKPIPKKEFIEDANKQFDAVAALYPNFADDVKKTKKIFDDNADARLKEDSYSGAEKNYITESLDNQLKEMGQQLKIIDQCKAGACSHEKMMSMLAETKTQAVAAQKATDAKAQAAFAGLGASAGASAGGKAGDNSDKGGQSQGFLNSDVVKLQNEAIREGFRPPTPNSGGNGSSGGAPGGSGSSGGSTSGTGGTSNGSSGGDTGANAGGSLADTIADLGTSAAAQKLASLSGSELDRGQITQASQDASDALTLDPSNRQAVTVTHFAAGRLDGTAPNGPDGAQVKGAAPGAIGSAAAGGASSARGFLTGSESRGSSGFAGILSGALGRAAGAPSAATLSGMSGAQARNAAQSAFAMRDYVGAMAFANRAIAQDPGNPELLNLRAMIYAGQRDYADSEADAKAGLAASPKDPSLLRSLGFAELRGKNYQGATATANEMLELNPNDPYAYAIRGHAYGSMSDRDAMMSDLQRAAELDPSFRPAAAQMASQVQLPSDKDFLFLFPGEEGAAPASAAAPGRVRNFGVLVGASVLGGLLLALGLLSTVLAPLKERLTSAFTRITRTGPTVEAAPENETEQPASVNGLVPGLIRGQYELSRQIGMGGMGMVFAGMDKSLGRPVAIKKMREELRVNPQERERFIIEAKTVAALHHPNIVDIYAIAEDGEDVFLIFEYVDGRTVHEVVQRSGRLAIADAARIVRGAADALGYAHSRGVVHRDMKPSNMMIDGSGGVKVMDFGIARMAKDAMTRFSMTNSVVGTPPYMAPEQEQGQVRRESDVYSLAVCAYEMMTGKLPFIGIGAGMLMNKINMSYVAPSRAIAGLPETLDPVFAKAFQAEPDKRYRTPKEFADALDSALPSVIRA